MSVNRKKSTTIPLSNSTSRLNTIANNNKRKSLTKPGWDSTNSNLEQFKASHEELEKRKVQHLSKNLDSIKNEKQRQSILKAKKVTPQQQQQHAIDSKVQLALLKEILFDDDQFKNLLLRSDATIKNAANLIENDNALNNNNKKPVKINFTLAPNADLNDSTLPQEIKKQSNNQNSKEASNFKTINNSLTDLDDNNDENDGDKPSINDLIKYRKFLIEKKGLIEAKKSKKPIFDAKSLQNLDELERFFNAQLSDDARISDRESFEQFNKAINDTNKINRVRPKISSENMQNQHASNTTNNSNSSSLAGQQNIPLNDLKKALEELENELIEYEEQTGRQLSALRISKHDTYSSYTISLVNVVSSLIQHLKQTTLELQTEKQKFTECAKQLDIHRKLIDGLTTEVITVKTQNERLVNQFANYQAKIETEMDHLRFAYKSSSGSDSARKLAVSNINLKPTQQQQQQQLQPQQRVEQLMGDYDRFSERLNAMLQTDIVPTTIVSTNSNLVNAKILSQNSMPNISKIQQSNINLNSESRPMSTMSRRSDYMENLNNAAAMPSNYYDFDSFLSIQPQTQPVSSSANNSRPTSAQPLGYHTQYQQQHQQHQQQHQQLLSQNTPNNFNSLLNTNKQLINDFNAQIQDLSVKNFEAQQKLKNLQQKQEINGQIENEFVLKFPETMQHFETMENHQTLNKLKEDQQLLKEQILILNRQRELAQKELDKIITNGAVPNLDSLNSIGIANANSHTRSSPNLSPIPNENAFPVLN